MRKRAGTTTKVSVSIGNDDLALLRERARRLHGGNLSAVVADLVAQERRRVAAEKLLARYGKLVEMTDAEREAIDRELLGNSRGRARRRGRAA